MVASAVLLAATAQYTAGFGFALLGVPLMALAIDTREAVVIAVWLPERTLTAILGVSVIAATVLLARGIELSSPRQGPEWAAGVVSGALASSLSTNGPPLVAVLQARRYPIAVFRATINTVFAVANVLTLVALAVTDELRAEQTWWSLVLLPLVGLGLVIGGRLRLHIDETRARRLVLGLLGVAGTSAVLSALVG
jgi:uncharacterized membrane protein YfcA